MNRYTDESLVLIGARPNSEWTLFFELGQLLERARRASSAIDVAQALLFQAPLRRCLVSPLCGSGPNAALMTLRMTQVERMSVCFATMPQGWGRKQLGHSLHLVALLAGRLVSDGEDVGELFGRLCRVLSDKGRRPALVQSATPRELLSALSDAARPQ